MRGLRKKDELLEQNEVEKPWPQILAILIGKYQWPNFKTFRISLFISFTIGNQI